VLGSGVCGTPIIRGRGEGHSVTLGIKALKESSKIKGRVCGQIGKVRAWGIGEARWYVWGPELRN